MRSSAGELDLRIVSDYVRAQNTESDRPLPLIPPFRLGGSLAYAGEQWLADLGVRYVAEQTRTAEFETTTPSYTLLDASVGYRLFSGRVAHDIILQGNNLTDEEARVHTSILKLQAPLPGRTWAEHPADLSPVLLSPRIVSKGGRGRRTATAALPPAPSGL
jgi:iron complex outermembrane receptor protein